MLLLPELFARQVARRPEAPALVAGGREWSYGQLAAEADRLARRLTALGVGPEMRVAVLLPRSPELIVALLGILEAGGVYVPLDPESPRERLAFQLVDAAAAVVCTDRQNAELLPELLETGASVVLVDDLAGEEEPAAGSRPVRVTLDPSHLAYVIYTSGSTGRPKGVGVSHGALGEHLIAAAATLGLGPGERALLFSSPSFDVSVEDGLAPLISGATLYVREERTWDPATFQDLVAELRLTVLPIPTAAWHQWLQQQADRPLPEGFALRVVLIGGEGMPPEAARLWARSPLGRSCRLLNGYGPTEAVVTATALEVTPAVAERSAGTAVGLGSPLPGRWVRILDRAGQEQPIGVPGELCSAACSPAATWAGPS